MLTFLWAIYCYAEISVSWHSKLRYKQHIKVQIYKNIDQYFLKIITFLAVDQI